MQQLMQPTVNGLNLEEWSLGFLDLLAQMDAETTVTSQLPDLAPLVHSPDHILWHARPASCHLVLQEIGSKHFPVISPVHDRKVLNSLLVDEALRVVILDELGLRYLKHPKPLEEFVAEQYFIGQYSDTECQTTYETGLQTACRSGNITFWSSPIPTERLFWNYQRLAAHFVHLNEYKLKTNPVQF